MRFPNRSKEYNEGYEHYLKNGDINKCPYLSDLRESIQNKDSVEILAFYRKKCVDWNEGILDAEEYVNT